MGKTVIKTTLIRRSFVLFVTLIGVAISVFVIVDTYSARDELNYIRLLIGIVGILVFGGFFLALLLNFNKPLLIIDSKGFTSLDPSTHNGFIPWGDVENISVIKVYSQKFVGVEIKDLEGFLNKLTKQKKKLAQRFTNVGHAPIMVSFNDAKETPDEVCSIMNRHIK